MKAYGKKRYEWEPCHRLGYLTRHDGESSWAIYRTFTPFSRRRHKELTTNKAYARQEGRIACELGA